VLGLFVAFFMLHAADAPVPPAAKSTPDWLGA
jgi:hypothetical protein